MNGAGIIDPNQRLSMVFYIKDNTLCYGASQRGKRCDLHVHSKFSGYDPTREECPVRWLEAPIKKLTNTKECYTPVKKIYRTAKKRGMDFVTISDHDSIEGAIKLTELFPDDTFINCEYTVDGSKGFYVHVNTPGLEYPVGSDTKLGVREVRKLHNELKKLRKTGFKEFSRQCNIMKVRKQLNHPASIFDGEIPPPELLEEWCRTFDYLEINKDSSLENIITKNIGEKLGGTLIAGTDDHTSINIGYCYTESTIPVNSVIEFLKAYDDKKVAIGALSHEDTFPKMFGNTVNMFRKDVYQGTINYFKYDWGWKKWLVSGGLITIPAVVGLLAGPAFTAIPLVIEGAAFTTIPMKYARNQKGKEAHDTRKLWANYLEKLFREEEIKGLKVGFLKDEITRIEEYYENKKKELDGADLIKPPSRFEKANNWILGNSDFFNSHYKDHL